MSKIKKNRVVFWITGLPGSGKTTIAKKIHNSIEETFGPTIEISGDELRKIFYFDKYDLESRIYYAKIYSNFCQFLVKKKYNVIISTVSLFHEVHKINRKNIKNYFEI
jgi:cytidine diphosphoramidate kinase